MELSKYVPGNTMENAGWGNLSGMDKVIEPAKMNGDELSREYSRRRDISLYDAYRITS